MLSVRYDLKGIVESTIKNHGPSLEFGTYQDKVPALKRLVGNIEDLADNPLKFADDPTQGITAERMAELLTYMEDSLKQLEANPQDFKAAQNLSGASFAIDNITSSLRKEQVSL